MLRHLLLVWSLDEISDAELARHLCLGSREVHSVFTTLETIAQRSRGHAAEGIGPHAREMDYH